MSITCFISSILSPCFPPGFHIFLFLSLLPFYSLSEYGAPFPSETAFVFENSVLRVTLEQDEYPSRLVCRACKPTSWLELWLFPARLLKQNVWRWCDVSVCLTCPESTKQNLRIFTLYYFASGSPNCHCTVVCPIRFDLHTDGKWIWFNFL